MAREETQNHTQRKETAMTKAYAAGMKGTLVEEGKIR